MTEKETVKEGRGETKREGGEKETDTQRESGPQNSQSTVLSELQLHSVLCYTVIVETVKIPTLHLPVPAVQSSRLSGYDFLYSQLRWNPAITSALFMDKHKKVNLSKVTHFPKWQNQRQTHSILET